MRDLWKPTCMQTRMHNFQTSYLHSSCLLSYSNEIPGIAWTNMKMRYKRKRYYCWMKLFWSVLTLDFPLTYSCSMQPQRCRKEHVHGLRPFTVTLPSTVHWTLVWSYCVSPGAVVHRSSSLTQYSKFKHFYPIYWPQSKCIQRLPNSSYYIIHAFMKIKTRETDPIQIN